MLKIGRKDAHDIYIDSVSTQIAQWSAQSAAVAQQSVLATSQSIVFMSDNIRKKLLCKTSGKKKRRRKLCSARKTQLIQLHAECAQHRHQSSSSSVVEKKGTHHGQNGQYPPYPQSNIFYLIVVASLTFDRNVYLVIFYLFVFFCLLIGQVINIGNSYV